MSIIRFKATLFKPDATANLGSAILLRLPKNASEKLPSRGMTMVEGTINGFNFRAVLEPDGEGSHWFKVDKSLRQIAQIYTDDTVELVIEPTKKWPEPKVPTDLKKVLGADPEAQTLWMDITPMARWDWIRWIGAAKQLETRKRRIETTCSMLKDGKRRPCCFDRTQCTLTDT